MIMLVISEGVLTNPLHGGHPLMSDNQNEYKTIETKKNVEMSPPLSHQRMAPMKRIG